jgi:hypothetical protein
LSVCSFSLGFFAHAQNDINEKTMTQGDGPFVSGALDILVFQHPNIYYRTKI